MLLNWALLIGFALGLHIWTDVRMWRHRTVLASVLLGMAKGVTFGCGIGWLMVLVYLIARTS